MKTIRYILTGTALLLLAGCGESPLQTYNAGNNVCFWAHVANHSLYGASPEDMPVDTIRVRLNIMGFTAPVDRTVSGRAVEDQPGTADDKRLTTATPDQYRILGGMIPAGETAGWFEVEVKNIEAIAEGDLKLNVRLTENEHFGPGLKENQSISLTWSRRLLQPETWRAMRFFFCADYSTQVYRIYMQVTGLKEFWYYNPGPDPVNNPEDAKVSAETGRAWGRAFGDVVRTYNAAHPDAPMLHDDGAKSGLPIIPIN